MAIESLPHPNIDSYDETVGHFFALLPTMLCNFVRKSGKYLYGNILKSIISF